MGLDSTLDVSWLYGVPWIVFISVAYYVHRAKLRAAFGQKAVTREGG
jgi:hypothetical protein